MAILAAFVLSTGVLPVIKHMRDVGLTSGSAIARGVSTLSFSVLLGTCSVYSTDLPVPPAAVTAETTGKPKTDDKSTHEVVTSETTGSPNPTTEEKTTHAAGTSETTANPTTEEKTTHAVGTSEKTENPNPTTEEKKTHAAGTSETTGNPSPTTEEKTTHAAGTSETTANPTTEEKTTHAAGTSEPTGNPTTEEKTTHAAGTSETTENPNPTTEEKTTHAAGTPEKPSTVTVNFGRVLLYHLSSLTLSWCEGIPKEADTNTATTISTTTDYQCIREPQQTQLRRVSTRPMVATFCYTQLPTLDEPFPPLNLCFLMTEQPLTATLLRLLLLAAGIETNPGPLCCPPGFTASITPFLPPGYILVLGDVKHQWCSNLAEKSRSRTAKHGFHQRYLQLASFFPRQFQPVTLHHVEHKNQPA
ncbi:unnamed protein product [Dibothriocephalus latus]|uniref:Uncharacterized protein n=1 Tax=Dibothriocephalus latus TaxID=60516 RepID=A0A3P6TDR4_DIBLA|nr:unnamed protein product [Dibothriocephalus latus]